MIERKKIELEKRKGKKTKSKLVTNKYLPMLEFS